MPGDGLCLQGLRRELGKLDNAIVGIMRPKIDTLGNTLSDSLVDDRTSRTDFLLLFLRVVHFKTNVDWADGFPGYFTFLRAVGKDLKELVIANKNMHIAREPRAVTHSKRFGKTQSVPIERDCLFEVLCPQCDMAYFYAHLFLSLMYWHGTKISYLGTALTVFRPAGCKILAPPRLFTVMGQENFPPKNPALHKLPSTILLLSPICVKRPPKYTYITKKHKHLRSGGLLKKWRKSVIFVGEVAQGGGHEVVDISA
jgi:hypothetical protein